MRHISEFEVREMSVLDISWSQHEPHLKVEFLCGYCQLYIATVFRRMRDHQITLGFYFERRGDVIAKLVIDKHGTVAIAERYPPGASSRDYQTIAQYEQDEL